MSDPASPSPIAVIGLSARLPGAESLDAFGEMLLAGRDAISEVGPERWDSAAYFHPDQGSPGKTYSVRGAFLAGVDEFDAPFFGIEAEEARRMDPQQRIALQEAWRTFEDAGYAPDRLRGRNVGVFVGARTGDYHDSILDRPEELEPQALMGHDTSILSARISHFLDLKGPNLTVNTACSSMGVALHLAIQSLRAGEVDMALVGGVHVMSTAQRFLMHSRSRLLSKSGKCRPFDERADGFVLGEAAGFVLLQRRADAVAEGNRIHGNILASGVNHGGRTEKGVTAPNPEAQTALIRGVLAQANIGPEAIDYVEAHGTGTYKGDALEAKALREAYVGSGTTETGTRRWTLGSTKANVGHALTAAVLPGLLKILWGFRHAKIAGQAHFAETSDLLRVEDDPLCIRPDTTEWLQKDGRPRRAALSAFSYTGTNFHMVLEEEPRRPAAAREPSEAWLIPLSAKTPGALREQLVRLEAWLASNHDAAASVLPSVARTLALGRAHFAYRWAVVVDKVDDCLARLRDELVRGEWMERAAAETPASGVQSEADRLLATLEQGNDGDARRRIGLWQLADLYRRGAEIRWDRLIGTAGEIVSLPGYPFERHAYWLGRDGDAVATDLTLFLSRRDDVYQHYLTAISGRPGFRPEPVVQVKCGDGGFRELGPRIYQVDARVETDYDRLVDALGPLAGKRLRVIHLWIHECETLDYACHGNFERCLHLVGRSLDTGARALDRLRRALARRGGIASCNVISLHHGEQPQNAMIAGWFADEPGQDGSWSIASLRLPDRDSPPGDVAALLLRASGESRPSGVVERRFQNARAEAALSASAEEASVAPLTLAADRVYLADIGDHPEGPRFLVDWARSGQGRLVVLVAPSRLAEAKATGLREVLWLATEDADARVLRRLESELARVGISELHGALCLTGESDRADWRRGVVAPLFVDELTKDAPLEFFLLLRIGAGARVSEATRFADGFAALRETMVDQGQRSGRSRAISLANGADVFGAVFTANRGACQQSAEMPVAGDRSEQVHEASANAQALEVRFKRIVCETLRLPVGELDLALSPERLGFNSMRIVEVVDRVRHTFGTELRPSLFYKHKTLRGVLDEWIKLAIPAGSEPNGNGGAGHASAAKMRARDAQVFRPMAPEPRHEGGDAIGAGPEPIAIVGMSGRFPEAKDLAEFWTNLRDGRDCIREIPAERWDWRQSGVATGETEEDAAPRWGGFIDDIDKFDPQFFGISAREAELMDPQQRLFLQCVWQAIEDAGHDPTTLAGSPTGVFVGVATCDYATILDEAGQGRQAHSPIGWFHSILANRVSYLLDLRGPSQPIDTACASSLVAVHRAVLAIRAGQCSQAIVGGVNALLTPALFAAFRQARMLAPDGRCKTFDARANGYVRGEGVGVLFLKPLRQARADGDAVYAVIRSSAENHGGHASSLTAPSPQAQAEVLTRAYREAGVDPRTVGYIEAHGTGTALGDPIEIDGLKQAFATLAREAGAEPRTGRCGIGSVKTNIGHLEAAAGIAGLIKVVLAMRHRTLPACLHFQKANPYLTLEDGPFFVVDKTQPWAASTDDSGRSLPRRAGVSSFGFGGVNAHVVLEEDVGATRATSSASPSPERVYPVVLSAKTEERLRESAANLLQLLRASRHAASDAETGIELGALACTLQVGRAAMEERLGLLVGSLDQLEAALSAFLDGGEVADLWRGSAARKDETLALFASDAVLKDAVGTWLKQENWPRILELWVKGMPVDWRTAYAGERPSRVHLPAYPFARERHWAEARKIKREATAAPALDGAASSRARCILRKQWEPCALPTAVREAGAVLVFANRETSGLARRLVERLPGSFLLDVDGSDAVGAATAIDWGKYAGCVDLTGCGESPGQGLEWLKPLRAFVDAAGKSSPVLLGVTRGLEAFRNATVNRAGALRAALYRMLQSEYAGLRSLHLDLDAQADEDAVVEQIVAELCVAGTADAEICYRAGQRYRAVLREEPEAAREVAPPPPAFPTGHVLWVTGGTRGLGALCAAHLVARTGVRKLVLTGREELPSRSDWSDWARRSGPLADKVRAAQALEAQGAEVRVLSVDLTDADALRRNLAEVRAEMGPTGGVLHCAGLVDEETPAFVRKSQDGMRRVLAPKVAGTEVLLDCFRDEPLAFMVLFSSVSALVPSLAAGLSDYAMANAWLDHAAEAGGRAFPVTSVQWPSWKETGMGEVRSAAYTQTGLCSLTNEEGLKFLDLILAAKTSGAVMPVVYDPARWAPETWLRHRERQVASAPACPLVAASGKSGEGSLPEATRAWLAQVFEQELKLAPGKLKPDLPFQDYGLDSILLAQAWKRINRTLGTNLDPSAVFEYPTLDALSAWLVRGQAQALAAALPIGADEGQAGAPATRDEKGPEPAAEAVLRRAADCSGAASTDIAVVGMSCRFPGADNLDAYWRLLAEGRSAIRVVPHARWANPDGFVAGLLDNITDFDPEHFLLPEADARAMDPQALLALEESLRLFHHAGYAASDVKGAAVGVYLGARTQHRPEDGRLAEARNPILAVGQNYLAANISRFLDLRGPSLVVDTACSSALVAMNLAVQALRAGDIGAAVVGGVSLLTSDAAHRVFRQRKLLSPGSDFHVFDRRAAGVVLGEGVGMVLLKTLAQAEADGDRVLAVVKGLAINNDGRTAGPATPNLLAQKTVMQAALARSGLRAGDVEHLEANGSGSEVTDLLELKAIEAVYGGARRAPCLLGSVKPNIGHPLCAEGIAGFIKLVLMLERGEQPPFLSGVQAMTHYDLAASPFAFRRRLTPWTGDIRRAALNCFADGGTNAHVILERRADHSGRAARRAPLPLPQLKRRSLWPVGAVSRNPWSGALDAEHPFLKNHEAYGQRLLPGLAYLDILYQFFRDKGVPLAELELSNLSIHHPLAVVSEADGGVRLAINAEQLEPRHWRVRIEEAELAENTPSGKPVLYVTAELRRGEGARFHDTLDIEAVRTDSETVSLAEAYAHFRGKGLVHTGPMKAEGLIHVSPEARLVELSLPDAALGDAEAYLFHPTLIDGAAVGAGPLFADLIGGEDRLFLPLFFGRFRALGPIRGGCFVRVRKASLRRKNELLYSDMEFFDAAGTKVAELTDFAYKLVRDAGAINADKSTAQAPRAMPESRAAGADVYVATGAAAELLQGVIATKLKRSPVEVDLRLGYYELGLESAMLLDVVAALEKRLGLSLSPTLLFEHATPAELAAYLEATYPAELARTQGADAGADESVHAGTRFLEQDFPLGAESRSAAEAKAGAKQAEGLVAELLNARLALWVDGGVLKARGEASRWEPGRREQIARHRDAIARVLGARKWLPMSRSQKRYWVLSSLQPGKSAYNNPIGMRLRGEIDLGRIRAAFLLLVNSHHVLRARFPRLGKGPVLVIEPPLAEAPVDVLSLASTDPEGRERELAELATRESRTPINPVLGPNLRIRVVPVAADEAVILLTAHHAVFDGYSYLPVMSEFMRLYRALGDGRAPDTAGLVQYEDYTLRERAAGDPRSGEFWRNHLAGAPASVALPVDRERAAVNAGHGDTRSVWIGPEACRAMNEAIQARRVTLFAFMLSILKAAVSSWAKQTDLVFGTTVQCRDEEADKAVIGDFTNFIPIRTRIGPKETFDQYLAQVYRTSLLCLQHKNFPFDEIVPLATTAPRNLNPVYNILVNQLPSITEMEERLSDAKVRVGVSNNRLLNGSAMLDLRFEWYEERGGLKLICEYNTDLFLDATIEAFLSRIETCLAARAYAREVPAGELVPAATVSEPTQAPSTASWVIDAVSVAPPADSGVAGDAVALVIQKVRELKEIPGLEGMLDVSFFELGLGSFDVANLSAELESIYPDFVVGDIFKHPTIRALAAYLNESGSRARPPAAASPSAPAEAVAPADENEDEDGVPAGECGIDFGLFRT